MTRDNLTNVILARRAHDRAAERLASAIERAYPVGAVIAANLGRSRVVGPVVGYYGTGYHLGSVVIENERTGKERRVYVADRSYGDVEILSTTEDLKRLRAMQKPVKDLAVQHYERLAEPVAQEGGLPE